MNGYIADGAAASAANRADGDDDDAEEGEGKAAALAAAVGGELLLPPRGGGVARGRRGERTARATPAKDACDAAAMVDGKPMRAAVSALCSRHESTTMAIVPLPPRT